MLSANRKRQLLLLTSSSLVLAGLLGLGYQLLPYALARYEYYAVRQTISSLPDNYLPMIDSSNTNTENPKNASLFASDQPILTITKLNIIVPVIPEVDTSRQYNYNTALKNGVAHMKGTAPLDSTGGNSFIFGHSSRFIRSGGQYDTVFANLDKLSEGDELGLAVDGRLEKYKVVRSQSVNADDGSVTESKPHRQITLMTCWPIGTTFKRWIVQADLVL